MIQGAFLTFKVLKRVGQTPVGLDIKVEFFTCGAKRQVEHHSFLFADYGFLIVITADVVHLIVRVLAINEPPDPHLQGATRANN